MIDEDMLLFARALKDKGTPMAEIANKLVIKTGKNAGGHPSAASLVHLAHARALREHVGLPVYDIYIFITWFQAGLRPRDFGYPASAGQGQ